MQDTVKNVQALTVMVVDDYWRLLGTCAFLQETAVFVWLYPIYFTEPRLELTHFKNKPQKYCLVIADLIMPSEGNRVANNLRNQSTFVKIVLIMGFSNDENLKDLDSIETNISKYFSSP